MASTNKAAALLVLLSILSAARAAPFSDAFSKDQVIPEELVEAGGITCKTFNCPAGRGWRLRSHAGARTCPGGASGCTNGSSTLKKHADYSLTDRCRRPLLQERLPQGSRGLFMPTRVETIQ